MKIGGITIGQSPRIDVTKDILPILGEGIEFLERGGLDGLSKEEIEKFKPENNDYILVSRLRDGSSVVFSEKYIIPRLQTAIKELEEEGVGLIIFLCTGEFPYDELKSNVPLIFPSQVLNKVVPLLSKKSKITVVAPDESQKEQMKKKWEGFVKESIVISASPYENFSNIEKSAKSIKHHDSDVVVLDCIGYTKEMKDIYKEVTGKPVVLPRTLVARIIKEVLD